jgi:hypothetical protein
MNRREGPAVETLERTLKELRLWSSPGRRAALVAAAWRYGETNVSTLARPSTPTSRPAESIRTTNARAHKKPPRWLEPLIPMWSHEATTEEEAWNAILGAANLPLVMQPANPPQDRSDELLDMMIRQGRYAQYHRAVLPLLGPEYECKLRASRAIHRAEQPGRRCVCQTLGGRPPPVDRSGRRRAPGNRVLGVSSPSASVAGG